MKEWLKIVGEVLWHLKFHILFVVVIFTTVPIACQDKKGTTEMLEKHTEYEIVNVGGYAWYKCPNSAFFRTNFIVKDKKTNKEVHGCYCTGLSKTIVLNDDGSF